MATASAMGRLTMAANSSGCRSGAGLGSGMGNRPGSATTFVNPRGRAKVELALAKGKKLHDKRETEKARDWKREQQRLLRERG